MNAELMKSCPPHSVLTLTGVSENDTDDAVVDVWVSLVTATAVMDTTATSQTRENIVQLPLVK